MRRILPGKVISLGMKCSTECRTRVDICESMRLRAGDVLKQVGAGKNVLLLTQQSIPRQWIDDAAQALANEGFAVSEYLLPEGEAAKSAEQLLTIWQKLQALEFDRSDTVFSIGGGAVSDIAGFAASTYLRGIRCVLMPTSLLAQVDAAIGGKTGINLESGKNLAGAIYMPEAVLIDLDVLSTLPSRELSSGMGEIVKYAYIEKTVAEQTEYKAGPCSLIDVLERSFSGGINADDPGFTALVASCVRMKLAVVAVDPLEHRLRRCLNLGHTLGHAIEKVSSYAISHGEGVSIGTVFALQVAVWKNRIDEQHLNRARNILGAMKLPCTVPGDLSSEKLLEAMMHDKKRAGEAIKFVLPEKEAGYVTLEISLTKTEIYEHLQRFRNNS